MAANKAVDVDPIFPLDATVLEALSAHQSIEHSEKKASTDDADVVEDKNGYFSDEKDSHLETNSSDRDSEVEWVNGEPVITTGRDVSKYLVDVRDDGDLAITFRSLVLGTVFAGLGASLVQVSLINVLSVPTSHR